MAVVSNVEACSSMAEVHVNVERNLITAGPKQMRNKLFHGGPSKWTALEVKKKKSFQNKDHTSHKLSIIFSYEAWNVYRTRSGFFTNDEAMMHLLSVHSNDHGRIECNVCKSEPIQHAVLNSLHTLKNQADDLNQQPYQPTGKVNSPHQLTSHDEISHHPSYHHGQSRCEERVDPFNKEIPTILDEQKPQVTASDFPKGRVQRRNCAMRQVHQKLKESCSFKRKMHRRVWCKWRKGLSRSRVQITHRSKQSLICRNCCYRSTRTDFFRRHYLWSHPRLISEFDSILGLKKVFQSRETFSVTNVMLNKKHDSNTSEKGPSMLKPISPIGVSKCHVDIEHEHGVSEGTSVELSSNGSSCKRASLPLSQSHPEDSAKFERKGSLDRTELSGEEKESKETDRALLPTTVPLVLAQPPAKKRTTCNKSNRRSKGRRRYQCQYCVHWFQYRQGLWRHTKVAHSELKNKSHANAKFDPDVPLDMTSLLGQDNSTTGTDTGAELSQIPVLDLPSKRRKDECTSGKTVNTTRNARKNSAAKPKKKRRQCPYCVHWFHYRQSLWRHIKNIHSQAQSTPQAAVKKKSEVLDIKTEILGEGDSSKKDDSISSQSPVFLIPDPPVFNKEMEECPSSSSESLHQCVSQVVVKHEPDVSLEIARFSGEEADEALSLTTESTYTAQSPGRPNSPAQFVSGAILKHEPAVTSEITKLSCEKADMVLPLSTVPDKPFTKQKKTSKRKTYKRTQGTSKGSKQSLSQVPPNNFPKVSVNMIKSPSVHCVPVSVTNPTSLSNRKTKALTVHRPKGWKRRPCSYCPQICYYRQSLWKHIQRKHSQTTNQIHVPAAAQPEFSLGVTELQGEGCSTLETDPTSTRSPQTSLFDSPCTRKRKTKEHKLSKLKGRTELVGGEMNSKEQDAVKSRISVFPVPARSSSNKRKTCSHTTGQCNVQRIKCHYCDHQYNQWQSLWRHVKQNHGKILSRSQMAIKRESMEIAKLTDKGTDLKSKSSSSVAHVLVSTSQQKEKSSVQSSLKHKEGKYLCTKCTNTYCHQQSLQRHVKNKHGKAQCLSDDASKQGSEVSVGLVQTSEKDHCNTSAVTSPIPTTSFPSLASQGLWKNVTNNHSLLTQEEEVPLEIAEFSCEGHNYYETVIPMSSGQHFEVDNRLSVSQPFT